VQLLQKIKNGQYWKLLNDSLKKTGYVLIGKIVGAHGTQGANKIRSYADSLAAFKSGRRVLIRNPLGEEKWYAINWVKPHQRTALLSLQGVTNRIQAEVLINSEVYIRKSELPKLDDDTFYWFDLIGMDVYTSDERYLGRLESIIPTGSNDVFTVRKGKKEVLIPALESVVREVDTVNKRMRVDLPEGLEPTP
jgi:16S rRNA processing protein RimM